MNNQQHFLFSEISLAFLLIRTVGLAYWLFYLCFLNLSYLSLFSNLIVIDMVFFLGHADISIIDRMGANVNLLIL